MYTSCLIFGKLVPKYFNFSVIHFAGVPLDSNISGIGNLITIFFKINIHVAFTFKISEIRFPLQFFSFMRYDKEKDMVTLNLLKLQLILVLSISKKKRKKNNNFSKL